MDIELVPKWTTNKGEHEVWFKSGVHSRNSLCHPTTSFKVQGLQLETLKNTSNIFFQRVWIKRIIWEMNGCDQKWDNLVLHTGQRKNYAVSTKNQNNLCHDSLPTEWNWNFSVIVPNFAHCKKVDVLVEMMERRIPAKPLFHIV